MIIRKNKGSIFIKITALYGVVIFVIIPLMMSLVSAKIESELRKRWQIENETAMQIISNYFNEKIELSYKVYERLFADRNVLNHAVSICKDESEYENIDILERKELVEDFENITALDDDIFMVSFYTNSSKHLFSYQSFSRIVSQEGKNILKGDAFVDMKKGKDVFTYEYTYWNKTTRCMGIVYNFSEIGSATPLAKLVISYDLSRIMDVIQEYLNLVSGQVLLLKEDGSPIFDSKDLYYGKVYPYYDQIKNNHELTLQNHLYDISRINLAEGDLYLYSIIPLEEIFKVTKSVKSWTYTLSILSLLVISAFYIIFSKILLRKVGVIINTMERISEGKMESRIQIKGKGNDEISRISRVFNHMCDQLMINMQNLLQTRERQKYAELEALQMKMDPHFIYNSLEIIKVRCAESGDQEAADILQTFSELFRESIRKGPVCSIAEELDTVKIYTDIMEMCYSDILVVQYNISSEILNFGIPNKLIQPIVENYFVHGFDRSKEDNRIEIQGKLENGYIIFRIIDNGKGMTKEKEELINERLQHEDVGARSYIGLRNASNRIYILFGPECGLKIQSEEQKGTTVTIKIAACPKEKLEERYQHKNQEE